MVYEIGYEQRKFNKFQSGKRVLESHESKHHALKFEGMALHLLCFFLRWSQPEEVTPKQSARRFPGEVDYAHKRDDRG
jgi:hypothetical protein